MTIATSMATAAATIDHHGSGAASGRGSHHTASHVAMEATNTTVAITMRRTRCRWTRSSSIERRTLANRSGLASYDSVLRIASRIRSSMVI